MSPAERTFSPLFTVRSEYAEFQQPPQFDALSLLCEPKLKELSEASIRSDLFFFFFERKVEKVVREKCGLFLL